MDSQYTATRCNTLQHAATRCNTLPCNSLQLTATHCNITEETSDGLAIFECFPRILVGLCLIAFFDIWFDHHAQNLVYWCVWHDVFIPVAWTNPTWDMMHSYGYGTWWIYMHMGHAAFIRIWDLMHSYAWCINTHVHIFRGIMHFHMDGVTHSIACVKLVQCGVRMCCLTHSYRWCINIHGITFRDMLHAYGWRDWFNCVFQIMGWLRLVGSLKL